jgi:predicted glutamine amidotransferase
MCELFGLSASAPAAVRNTPLGRFPPRGGQVADNPDGWGLAWREADGPATGKFQLAKEPTPGWQSARFARLAETLVSDLVVGHVRKARFPPVNSLNNTHPFQRECCGRNWVFAHNGLVPEVVELERDNRDRYCRPEGETDSEFAFCHLLGQLHGHPAGDWLAKLGRISASIAQRGKFNFLLSDGIHLIAYGHDRLHFLETTGGPEAVALVATEPLSDHPGWTSFAPGELRIYRSGALVERLSPPASWADTGIEAMP